MGEHEREPDGLSKIVIRWGGTIVFTSSGSCSVYAMFGNEILIIKCVLASIRLSVHPSVGWLVCYVLFFDASSHLYKRVCPVVCRLIGWSVSW